MSEYIPVFSKKTIVVWNANTYKVLIEQKLLEMAAAGKTPGTSGDYVAANGDGSGEYHRLWSTQAAAEEWIAFINSIDSDSALVSTSIVDNP